MQLLVRVLIALVLLSLVLSAQGAAQAADTYMNLTTVESNIVALINGTNAYNYDLELERIALDNSISGYSFRSSGSAGANESARWIQGQFESLGLETTVESFEFTTWNLPTKPILAIDEDGNRSTTGDVTNITSFVVEHYSWPTPPGGVFADIVMLPVPESGSRRTLAGQDYDAQTWSTLNTTGKILLIGREVRWISGLHLAFRNKIRAQPPVAVIFTYWNSWMSDFPPSLNSVGGLPVSDMGRYFWDNEIPVGWVDYSDGLRIRNRVSSGRVSGFVSIQAVITESPHQNVIGKLVGTSHKEKTVIISGHYDTVTASGFCDNGAGTAGVIELARVFSKAAEENLYRPEYSFIFVAFAGEELGLVGSINYVRRHTAELNNVIAVINLDCIGSDVLEISETFQDDRGLDLESIVKRSATDLGLTVRVIEPGGSDQETFRNPLQTDDVYRLFWGLESDIRNATRIKSSIMISSYPLFISDIWAEGGGKPGWIHTPYDNSTSTTALNWVDQGRLEKHIQVAALSVLRVTSTTLSSFMLQIYLVAGVAGTIAVMAAYLERSRLGIFLKDLRHEILAHFGTKEVVYVMAFVAVLLFVSYSLHLRVGNAEIINDHGYPSVVRMQYFGTPFEMVGFPSPTSTRVANSDAGLEFIQTDSGQVTLLWQGFILNVVLFSLLGFALVYAIAKIRAHSAFSIKS